MSSYFCPCAQYIRQKRQVDLMKSLHFLWIENVTGNQAILIQRKIQFPCKKTRREIESQFITEIRL